MGYKDLHESPFKDNTIMKLEIFEDYAQAWIPTFVMQGTPEMHIFDFFAGTGYDKNGIPGSPIRILEKIREQKDHILQKQVKITIHLNELKQQKFELLKEACSDFCARNAMEPNLVNILFYMEDFESLFPRLMPTIKEYPSLVYLDQNGIKFLSEKYFLELEKTSQTDFLYFVSSSYFWRFGERDEFKLHLDIDMAEAKRQGYKQVHRVITEQLRKKLPANTKLKIYPFTLKKGSNIHGIIFGASHPRAVDKFLAIGWKRNGKNGDANFDIDEEAKNIQMSLFDEPKLTKIESFKNEVADRVLSKKITNNFDLLDYTYEAGHIPAHASDCVKKLKDAGKIDYDATAPLVSYESVFKKRKLINYKVLGLS